MNDFIQTFSNSTFLFLKTVLEIFVEVMSSNFWKYYKEMGRSLYDRFYDFLHLHKLHNCIFEKSLLEPRQYESKANVIGLKKTMLAFTTVLKLKLYLLKF